MFDDLKQETVQDETLDMKYSEICRKYNEVCQDAQRLADILAREISKERLDEIIKEFDG